jgi:tRNA pseudouridine38-40 synthase
MRNICLLLRFDGSAFHGWQTQANAVTVQTTLEHAIERVTGEKTRVIGCSRTDTGVHAERFFCNFVLQKSMIPTQKLPFALNYYLPVSVAALACREMPHTFHARYDCVQKTYCYLIRNSAVRDPFLQKRAYLERIPLDESLLGDNARDLIGVHDFAAFCACGGSAKTTVREVYDAHAERDGELVRFFVTANGFLYNMVRIMVGTLLDIAKNRLPSGSIPSIIASKNRACAGVTAPAEGLYLVDVKYNEQIQ